jgi:hypothetical protein
MTEPDASISQPESPEKKAASSPERPPASSSKELSREDFLRSMGLTRDDLKNPPNTDPRLTDPSEAEDVQFRREGQLPPALNDDQWVRQVQFADAALIAAGEDSANNEAKLRMVEEFRTKNSITSSSGGDHADESPPAAGGSSAAGSSPARRATELVTKDERAVAAEYKNQLLAEYRAKKARAGKA